MKMDTIEQATYSRSAPGHAFRRPVALEQQVCFHCRKLGHHAAVCRAPAPVLAVATSDVSVSVADKTK